MKGMTAGIFLAVLIVGIIGVSASTFGLGKAADNRSSATYQVAEVGTIIGALMSLVGLAALAYGAMGSRKCTPSLTGQPAPLGSMGSLNNSMGSLRGY